MATALSLLANILGGLIVASMVAAMATSWAFFKLARAFTMDKLSGGRIVPYYALCLQAGIWACATGTALNFTDAVLIRFHLTESPLFRGPTLFAHLLAVVGTGMVCAGYALHRIASHAVLKPADRGFPLLWTLTIATIAVISAAALWWFG